MDFDPRDFDDSRNRNEDLRDRDDERRPEHEADPRERGDRRDIFTKDFNLPSGLKREIVRDRGREYTLRGSPRRHHAKVVVERHGLGFGEAQVQFGRTRGCSVRMADYQITTIAR